MYYLMMAVATIIFASNVWVIQEAVKNGWGSFFLSFCSYFLAACCSVAVALWKKQHLFRWEIWKKSLRPAVILFIANIFLLFAVQSTLPERIGFIVGLTVLFVPLIQFFLYKSHIPRPIYLSLGLAFLGNIILNYHPGKYTGFYWGDIFALVTTLCYALSIIWIHECSSSNIPAETFVFIQSTVASLGYIILMAVTSKFQNPLGLSLFPVFFLGFISYIVGNSLQFIAQKNMPSVVASIILASTSIIGVFIGFFFFDLELSFRILAAAVFFGSAGILGAYGYSQAEGRGSRSS